MDDLKSGWKGDGRGWFGVDFPEFERNIVNIVMSEKNKQKRKTVKAEDLPPVQALAGTEEGPGS